ncbi:hypothetical protein GF357_01560 [Candidatus Dojkabacteria bacterium]|nr:hypothetical protein [Candidatus Dojkabacteria bacterium]
MPKSLKIKHSLVPAIIAVTMIQAVISAAYILSRNLYFSTQYFPSFQIFWILTLIFDVIFSLYYIYRWLNSYYVIKKSSVLYVKKLTFFTKKSYFTFNENVDLKMVRSFWGKLFNFGSIKIVGTALDKKVTLKRIRRPDQVLDSLINSIFKIRKEKFN